MFYLEMSIEHLVFAKEELESSKTPYFLSELEEVLKRVIILDNNINNSITKKHSQPNLYILERTPPKVEKQYADFEYVLSQIEGVLVDIGNQMDWWKEEWFWLIDEINEVNDLLINLYDDIEALVKLMDVITLYNPSAEFYDLLSSFRPGFTEVLQRLKRLKFPISSLKYISDPTQKELPRPKRGFYRKSSQTFTTYPTGSKAMLVLQGTGLKADNSKKKQLK